MLTENNIIEAAEALPPLTEIQNAACLNIIGEILLRKGETNKALEAFEKALKLNSNKSEEAAALNHIAIAYKNAGNNSLAVDYMQQAMKLVKEHGDKQRLAAAYNDFGLVMSNIDNDQALDYYLEALKLYQEVYETEHENIAQILINLGVIYRNMEFYGDAINNFQEANKIADKVFSEAHPTRGFILFNIGQTYYEMSNPETALDFFEKALVIYQNHFGSRHPDIARTLNIIGNTHHRQGNFEKALEHYQKALIANSSSFNIGDIEQNPDPRSYLHANTLLNTLYFKAQALEDYHFNFSLDFKDLKLSLSTLYTCDTLVDQIRQVTNSESDKIALSALASQVYENGVRISYAMADMSFKKEEYFEHAFYFAEKSKSAVLLEAISDASAKSFANIPQETVEKEQYFKDEIAFYEQKLAEFAENEVFREKLFQLKQDYRQFIETVERNYPSYFNLKYNVNIPSMQDLQATLDDGTAIVSYFVEETSSRLYVFQISERRIKVDNVKLTEDFDRYISGFRNSLYFKDDEVYKITGHSLYETLFPSSLPGRIVRLTIIPAGRLGTIPFEALLTDKVKDEYPNYSTLPYLIRDYAVNYQYAVALYYQNLKKEAGKHQNAALLCAPVQFTSLEDLPGTREEVADLEAILDRQGISSELLLQADATEQIFKSKNLSSYKYLHLATHGVVDELAPSLSKIYLKEEGEAGDLDGSLYSGEIYNLNLNADLVTLSACETGLGKLSKGEGIIGLSRALVYAGANNLVVSLWKVADQSTARLMTSFYSRMDQYSYRESLRKAKLDLLNSNYSHPFYWAPFILIGQ
ncbi:MAG: CHAT domain-containing tetratricopeptide repeat protein [Fulvivirga sp.]|nr:CHAT domain-containing tetratricopeptide repeat protein [Fulvivirga sp.]